MFILQGDNLEWEYPLIINQAITILLIFINCIYSRSLFIEDYYPDQEIDRTTRPEKTFLIHTTNNMWSSLTNFGSVGDPNSTSTGRPSAQWPAGSGNNYLYDSGIWIAAEIGGEPIAKTYFYNNDMKEWEPTVGFNGEIGSYVNNQKSKSLEDSFVVFDDIDSEDISNQAPLGIKLIQRGLTWSLPEYDDFIAFELSIINTGLNGDLEDLYIAFWYDIDVSSSDADEPHIDDLVDYDGWDGSDSNTDINDYVDPFDLDGDGLTGYDEWGVPFTKDIQQNPNYDYNNIEPDGFYDEWSVILDSDGDVIYWQSNVEELNRVAGELAIVNGDTLRGWVFPRSLSYIYDGDNSKSSANDYGERENIQPNEGFLGGAVLYTEADLNTLEDGSQFMGASSHQWWNWESDPGSDQEIFDFMQGKHVSSAGKKFLNNPLELGYPEFDYRFLLTTGPVDVDEGDTTKVVYVLGCGTGLEGLRESIDNAYIAYYSGSNWSNPLNPSSFNEDVHWNLPIPPLTPELSYSPLNNAIRLAWDTNSEYSYDANLGAIDFEGYQVYRSLFNPQDWELIASYDNINENVFVVHINGDTLNEKNESGDWITLNLPSIQNSFDDYGHQTLWNTSISSPINGLPYYYTVSAYDGYKSAEEAGQELFPSYSPLVNYKKSIDGAPISVSPGQMWEEGDEITALDEIKVVPNPYRGTALWENQYEDRIRFNNLPPVCKISIFSLSGDLIKIINHNNGSNYESWNLISKNTQSIVSGVYIYVVEAPEIDLVGQSSNKINSKIGKFVVFR